MKKYRTLAEPIGWVMFYIFMAFLLYEKQLILISFSIIYWIIYAINIKISAEKEAGNSTNGLDIKVDQLELHDGKKIYIPTATKRTIHIMLQYYTVLEVANWAVRTYKWSKDYSISVAKAVFSEMQEEKNH